MSNPWFRLYSEFADDPKVQMMTEAMQRRLLMLMCSHCKGETLHETELAFHWRVTETDMAETKAVFLAKGFIDEDWKLLNWNRRQFISDSSTERVRRHRVAKKQDETLHETDGTNETVTVTPPEQNRTEQIQKKDIVAQAQLLYALYPKHVGKGKAIPAIQKALRKVAFDVLQQRTMLFAKQRRGQDEQFTPHPATWFAQERWEDESLNKPVVEYRTVDFDDPEYLKYRAKQEADFESDI